MDQAPDPIPVAIRHVAETRRLLEDLITSSESFDYLRAKRALRLLRRKLHELRRVQADWEQKRPACRENICRIDFRSAAGQ